MFQHWNTKTTPQVPSSLFLKTLQKHGWVQLHFFLLPPMIFPPFITTANYYALFGCLFKRRSQEIVPAIKFRICIVPLTTRVKAEPSLEHHHGTLLYACRPTRSREVLSHEPPARCCFTSSREFRLCPTCLALFLLREISRVPASSREFPRVPARSHARGCTRAPTSFYELALLTRPALTAPTRSHGIPCRHTMASRGISWVPTWGPMASRGTLREPICDVVGNRGFAYGKQRDFVAPAWNPAASCETSHDNLPERLTVVQLLY